MAIEIPKGGFRDEDGFLAWLESLAVAQRMPFARVLAHRAALRALPFLNSAYSAENRRKLDPSNLTLSAFRANVISRVARKFTDQAILRSAVDAANATDEAAGDADYFSGGFVADASTGAAFALTRYSGSLFISAKVAYSAARAAAHATAYAASHATAGAEYAVDAANSADAIWIAITDDVRSLIEKGTAKRFEDTPLWPHGAPKWWENQYDRLDEILSRQKNLKGQRPFPPHWSIWLGWYDSILVGIPPWNLPRATANELEKRIALGDGRDDFWDTEKRSVAEINAEIAGWVEEARAGLDPDSNWDEGKWDEAVWDGDQTTQEPTEHLPAWDYFISYSSRDESMAREIDEVVRSTGKTTFVQFRDFGPGKNLVREMQAGLAGAGRVIAVTSPDYEASDHCQAEWAAAYNADPGSVKGKLLPFLVRPTELNPLARQIVYVDLVGKSKAERRLRILEALDYKPRQWNRDGLRNAFSDAVTPLPALEGKAGSQRVGVRRNEALDQPATDEDLRRLPELTRQIADVIILSLPGNTPPAFRNCLVFYRDHLSQHGIALWTDSIRSFGGPIKDEFEATELELWGAGLAGAIRDFLGKHEKLLSHFPLPVEREKALSETPLDEDKAVGTDLTDPIEEAAEALDEMSEAGLTTEEFDSFVEELRTTAGDLSRMLPTEQDNAKPSTAITPKRRFVARAAGFFWRTAEVLAVSTTLGQTASGQAAIVALRNAAEKLLALFL